MGEEVSILPEQLAALCNNWLCLNKISLVFYSNKMYGIWGTTCDRLLKQINEEFHTN